MKYVKSELRGKSDHRRYVVNGLVSCENNAWKNFGLNGTTAIPVQCSPSELSSQLGAGHIVSSYKWVLDIPVDGGECKSLYETC